MSGNESTSSEPMVPPAAAESAESFPPLESTTSKTGASPTDTTKTTTAAKTSTAARTGKTQAMNLAAARRMAEHRKWKKIEWVWTLVPVGLLLVVGLASAGLLYNLGTGPTAFGVQPNYQVNVTGQQWLWSFQYGNGYDVPGKALPSNISTNDAFVNGPNGKEPALFVPQNAVVWLNVTSVDVIHDFNVDKLGVRIDAIPGRINHYWFTIPAGTAPWTEFLIQCTEFCGAGHYSMLGYVVVTPASTCLSGGACGH